MLKTCSVCGTIHDFNKTCRRSGKKKTTNANTFRKTNKWTEKSKSIRERDKHLCQICLTGKYDTNYRYTYEQLEVHHIVPIEEDYSKRLDSMNLITLCKYHHKMAEKGQISKEELLEIVAGKY
jgi:5-methylcytosine-specific restriction protein A